MQNKIRKRLLRDQLKMDHHQKMKNQKPHNNSKHQNHKAHHKCKKHPLQNQLLLLQLKLLLLHPILLLLPKPLLQLQSQKFKFHKVNQLLVYLKYKVWFKRNKNRLRLQLRDKRDLKQKKMLLKNWPRRLDINLSKKMSQRN